MSLTHLRFGVIISFPLLFAYCGSTTNSTEPEICSPKLISGASSLCQLSLSGAVTTFAGSGVNNSVDGIGTSAQLATPGGLTTDGINLFITEPVTPSHKIRKIVIATGVVTTIAGGGQGNANGVGVVAKFDHPSGITTDGTNLYIADTLNYRIRKIVIATATVTTLAGSSSGGAAGADGIGVAATFAAPKNLTIDGTNLYVTDGNTIRKIVIATGVVTTIAGSSTQGYADGIGNAAIFYNPLGITTDGTNLYVVDSGNHRIRKIVIATGVVTTLAGGTFGYANGIGPAAAFWTPAGITKDETNLYIADTLNYRIRKLVIATGVVTTIAGSSQGFSNGGGAAAKFDGASDVTNDGVNLYVADTGNYRIRTIK